MENETFEGWCILELMGHRKLAGYVGEQEIAGAAFLRLDVFDGEQSHEPVVTQFYSASSVYCVTPTTEEIARKLGARSTPRPVARYELEPPPKPPEYASSFDPEDDDPSF